MTARDEEDFRLRDVALTAYGPPLVDAIGYGAVVPVLALRARELGADVSTAALVVALLGIGMLCSSLPSGVLVDRIGERRALFLAGVVDAAALTLAAVTGSVPLLATAVVVSGMSRTMFLIARQGFMIDAVPVAYRARALSTLGGTSRFGMLLGPLLGAGVIHVFSLSAVFVMAAGLALAAGSMALLMRDPGSAQRSAPTEAGRAGLWSVIAEHRRVLLTLGVAVVVISASRSVRNGLVPLWADHIGLSASTVSLLLAFAAGVDTLFFYPGGWLMDTRGRAVVAVPVVLSVAVASLLLPLTDGALGVAAVVALIALGNGLGSGIVMTLGADAAPVVGRGPFLGAWRLCGDIGQSGGPLLVSAAAAVAPLAAACVVVGGLGLLGTGWVAYWTRREDLRLM